MNLALDESLPGWGDCLKDPEIAAKEDDLPRRMRFPIEARGKVLCVALSGDALVMVGGDGAAVVKGSLAASA